MSNQYSESTVRTKKLHCTTCKRKLNKGERVIFELTDDARFKGVFCKSCQCETMVHEVIMNSSHPFSTEALGQD